MRKNLTIFMLFLLAATLSWAVSGHITDNVVWDTDQTITGDLFIDDGAVLTINAGVTVTFPKIDNDLDGIGDTRFVVDGRLIVNGADGNEVIFTSLETSPAPSDWSGITFSNSGAIYSVLNYMQVYYADEGIHVDAKYVTMNNCVIAYCNDFGVKVTDSYSGLTSINNTIIFNNTTDGMIILSDAIVNGDGVISSSNGRYGFDITNSQNVTFDNSGAINNGDNGINVTNAIITFSNTDISDNTLNGVFITGASADADFDNCCITNNGKMGALYETDAVGDITYSTITDNAWAGVWVQTEAAPTVNYSNIYGNVTNPPTTYIFTEDIPSSSLYYSGSNGYSNYYTTKFPVNLMTQARMSGWMDHYSSSSDYNLYLYDENSNALVTYLRNNSSYDTNLNSWFDINTTSTSQSIRIRVYAYYYSGTPWGRCTELRYDLTSYINDFTCINETQVVNAEYNWWGQITGVNSLVTQLNNGTVSYTNLQVANMDGSACNLPNLAPTIDLYTPTSLELNPTSYDITWMDIDVDDNATISLYYDDGLDYTGTAFATDISEDSATNSYTWDFTDIPHGLYNIYAVIDDGVNAPVMDYAAGQVMVGPLSAGITQDETGAAGETVAIPVFITNSIPQYNILSFQFTITYDFTLLTAIDVTTAGTLTENWSVNYNAGTVGEIVINGFNTTALQEGGTLLYVNMTVAGNASDYDNCQLNFTNFVFNETAEAVVQHNGLFTVYNKYDIDGTVSYFGTGNPLPGVTLTLTGDDDEVETSAADGTYTFADVSTGNYVVTPSTDIAIPALTVTPYDAALTARYSLGLEVFNPNQVIAADASGNGSVSVYDSALMAQYALGIITELPGGTWMFSPESTSIEIFEADETADFSAIVIGDPSGNYPGSAERAIEFNTQPVVLTPNTNGEYILEISSDENFYSVIGSINYREELTLTDVVFANQLSDSNCEFEANNGNIMLSAWDVDEANAGSVATLIFTGNVAQSTVEVEYFAIDEIAGGIFEAPTGTDEEVITPVSFALNGNHPNPFNPETSISFSVPTDSEVKIDIYNIKGEKVRTLTNELYKTGTHSVVWNGRTDNGNSVASGVYFYRMDAGSYSAVRKMALLK